MNVKCTFWGCLSLLLVASAVSAVEWSDLSSAARRLVPEERTQTIHLTSGQTREGVITRETEDHVDLLMKRREMDFEISFSRDIIDRIEEQSVCHDFRSALETIAYDSQRNYTKTECQQAIALIEEYLELCPGGEDEEPLREQIDAFAADLERLESGLQQVGDEWMPAVAATLQRFNQYDERLDVLVERFPRVVRPGYDEEPRAAHAYSTLMDARRRAARSLPELVNQSIPQMLEQKEFMGAAQEATAFSLFWIERVIGAGSRDQRLRDEEVQEVFDGMDFGFINRIKQRILTAYLENREADPRAGEVNDEGMVYIPGGFFVMGDPDADVRDDAFPLRLVWLDAYWLDQHEVTNREYREFVEYVQETGDYSMAHPDSPPLKNHTPEGWSSSALAGDDQPVVGVDWYDAYAYAKWRGKRLPTEAEWERAARGDDQRLYPWGDEPTDRKLVNWTGMRNALQRRINATEDPDEAAHDWDERQRDPEAADISLADVTWNVDALQPPETEGRRRTADVEDAVGPWGLYHMAGNAAEWVQDYYSPDGYLDPEIENPTGASDGQRRVFRGGSFQSETIERLSASHRNSPEDDRRRARKPVREFLIGIRCAKDVEEQP